jgi:peptide deformylase
MKLLTIGHPGLLQRASPVTAVDEGLREQIAAMHAAMDKHNGVGLAAPQVGIPLRFFVIRLKDTDERLAFVNPVIVSESARRETAEEGCLSVPGLYGPVERAVTVTVRYLDQDGKEKTLKASDMLARVIQHEYDHLEGRLFIHRMEPERLAELKREIEEAEREKLSQGPKKK